MKRVTIGLLVLLHLTLPGPRPVAARKCIGYAYEIMELDLVQVSQGRVRVPAPALFADRAWIQSSGAMGKQIRIRDAPDGQLAQLYKQAQTIPPARWVTGWLRETARRRARPPAVPGSRSRRSCQPGHARAEAGPARRAGDWTLPSSKLTGR